MAWVRIPRIPRTLDTSPTISSLAALACVLCAACSAHPTGPTSEPGGVVVASASQTAPPTPPRLGVLPPASALGATRFVAFGDSITYGTLSGFITGFLYDDPAHSYPVRVQLSLQQIFPSQAAAFQVVNAGVPGERAVEGKRRIAAVIQAQRPQGLLLLEGINDMTFGTSHLEAAAAVAEIVQIARLYNVTVLVATMPQTYAAEYPNGETRTQASDRVVPFNNELRRLVTGVQNVHLVDLYRRFGTNRDLMGNDGLHPTAEGYELMAATFVQALESVFPVRGILQ